MEAKLDDIFSIQLIRSTEKAFFILNFYHWTHASYKKSLLLY